MASHVLVEVYLQQIREVAARGGPQGQIVKLADLALTALSTMQTGIVGVRGPTESSAAPTAAAGSSPDGQEGP